MSVVVLLCLLALAAPVAAGVGGGVGVGGGADTGDRMVAGVGADAGDRVSAVADVDIREEPRHAGTSRVSTSVPASLEPSASEQVPLRNTDDAPTGSFGRDLYATTAGDLVDIDVSVGNGPVYVVIGGDRLSDGTPTGFLDVLRVDAGRTITVNTRLLGTNASTDEVYATDAGGGVYSYAHADEWDAATKVTETAFSDLAFEREDEDGAVVEEYESLEELRAGAGVGYNPAPLAPQRYRLLVGYGDTVTVRDGTVHLEHRLDRSDLRLVEPDFRERIDVYTALDDVNDAESIGDVLEPARERDAVTNGDRVILGFEATGIWGALAARSTDGPLGSNGALDADVLHDLTTSDEGAIRGEGVTLTVRQTNVGMNERRTELDLADADPDDVRLLYGPPEALGGHGNDPSPSAFYLVIDTGADSGFTDDVEPGDEYAVEFGLDGTEGYRYRFHRPDGGAADPFAPVSATDDGTDDQFPYLGVSEDGVSTTATFSIREPTLEFDDRSDDLVLVENGTTMTLSGTTTLHPETDLTAEFVADTGSTASVDRRSVEIAENDTFSVETDLAGVTPGSPISLELYDGSELYDTRSLVVVEDVERPYDLAIDDSPETVTVTRGETLANLSVTVRNDGHVDGVERLFVDVGEGQIESDRRVRVRPDRRSDVSFSRTVVDIDPGEYSYTVGIDGDEAVGRLVVEPGPDWESPEDTDDGDEEDDTGDSDSEDDTGHDGDGEDDTGAEDPGDENADETDDPDDGVGDESSTDVSDGTDDGANESDDDDGGADGGADDNGADDEGIDEDGSDDDGGDGGTDEEDEPGEERASIPLPFGIGTREAFTGTIVVGAMYVADHWI